MKKNFRHFSALVLIVVAVIGSMLSAQAAEPTTKTWEGIFDVQYYADHNPDVVAAVGTDPQALRNHFYSKGVYEEGRDVSVLVDFDQYVRDNPDVAAACGNDRLKIWQHLEEQGIFECRPGVTQEPFEVVTETTTVSVINGKTTTSVTVTHFSRDEDGTVSHYQIKDGVTTVFK